MTMEKTDLRKKLEAGIAKCLRGKEIHHSIIFSLGESIASLFYDLHFDEPLTESPDVPTNDKEVTVHCEACGACKLCGREKRKPLPLDYWDALRGDLLGKAFHPFEHAVKSSGATWPKTDFTVGPISGTPPEPRLTIRVRGEDVGVGDAVFYNRQKWRIENLSGIGPEDTVLLKRTMFDGKWQKCGTFVRALTSIHDLTSLSAVFPFNDYREEPKKSGFVIAGKEEGDKITYRGLEYEILSIQGVAPDSEVQVRCSSDFGGFLTETITVRALRKCCETITVRGMKCGVGDGFWFEGHACRIDSMDGTKPTDTVRLSHPVPSDKRQLGEPPRRKINTRVMHLTDLPIFDCVAGSGDPEWYKLIVHTNVLREMKTDVRWKFDWECCKPLGVISEAGQTLDEPTAEELKEFDDKVQEIIEKNTPEKRYMVLRFGGNLNMAKGDYPEIVALGLKENELMDALKSPAEDGDTVFEYLRRGKVEGPTPLSRGILWEDAK